MGCVYFDDRIIALITQHIDSKAILRRSFEKGFELPRHYMQIALVLRVKGAKSICAASAREWPHFKHIKRAPRLHAMIFISNRMKRERIWAYCRV